MIEKLEIEKLQKGEMVDKFTFTNICLITNKINEIIDYINKENSGEVDYKAFIDLIFPDKN